ncbi:MAG TPA: hypothetical protein VL475_00325, partial [Planctomycetaceae bacterium]|nr:hypothetical protein [Planctomycetaceae bacterium]
MSPTSGRGLWILWTALFVGAGCGEKPPAPPAVADVALAERVPPDPASVPESADAAVQAVIDGMKQGHPEALWYFLPASYQKDVNEVVHSFAGRMDAEIWSRTVAVLEKLSRVIKSQHELVQATMPRPVKAGRGAAPPSVDFEGLASLLQTLVKSELGDLEKLKQADVGRILAVTGGQLLAQLQSLSRFSPSDGMSLQINDLAKLKVSLVSSEGDAAIVRVEAPGEDPRDLDFVRVEGKWIPKDLSESWIETIGEANARLSLVSRENLAAKKQQWLTLVATFDNVLDQMAAARDKDQFAAATQSLIIPGMMLAGMFQGPPEMDQPEPAENETTPSTAADLVTVVVRGKFDSAAQDALLEKLKASAGAQDQAFAEFTGDDEMTSYKIGPVRDVEAFARQLDFLKVVEV